MRKEVIQIRCSDVEKQDWTEAAKLERITLSDWIRKALRDASYQHPPGEIQLFPPPDGEW